MKAKTRCSIHPFVVSAWSESLLVAIIQPAGITVVYPKGGESWKKWGVYTIQWSYTGDPEPYVKIELLRGRGLNQVITDSTSAGSDGRGSCEWRASLSQSIGSGYKIGVTSTSNASYTPIEPYSWTNPL